MKRNNKSVAKKALKQYGLIGKSLCGFAGAIIGFVLGGPLLAIPGIVVGTYSGALLEHNFSSLAS